MSLNQDLLFHIIYYDYENTIQIPKWKTIGDLKAKIEDYFGIESEFQQLDCWHKKPENDNCVLENCCLENEVNLLVLKDQNAHSNDNIDVNLSREFVHKYNIEEIPEIEEKSCVGFLEYLTNNYNDTVNFHNCSLQCALDNSCFAPLKNRKILLLYFHNKSSDFSKLFCTALKDRQVQEVVNRSFFCLGWDVEKNYFHSALCEILNAYIELSVLINLVNSKTCAAFLIVSINQHISICTSIQGSSNENDIIETFKNVEDSFWQEIFFEEELYKVPTNNENPESDFGTVKFQQLMCDLLGDRDYDSFEHDQHSLLKSKIGYAFFGPPNNVDGYNAKQDKKIDSIFNVILRENNKVAKWRDRVVISFIYNCTEPLPKEKLERAKTYSDYNPKTDLTPFPIFVLRKCKKSANPCRIFIDDIGRVYENWSEYINRNKLPKCEMALPLNGRYETDENGKILLETHLSPACGINVKILQGSDIASTTAGFVSGGVMMAAAIPAIPVSPMAVLAAGVAGIGIGVYAMGRSIYNLYDKGRHKESLSFANSEARGAYLNILAGSLGFFGAGTNLVVSQLVAKGVNIGEGGKVVVNAINVLNLGASGASVINSGYDVLDQWLTENQRPTLLTIVQLSASILFFGNALHNFRTASALIEESQAGTLKEYREWLCNNKYKKILNKLTKETVKNFENDVKTGVSEIISAIRNIDNKEQVFAILAKSNELFSRNGLRLTVGNGQITLNDVQINIGDFLKMTKGEICNFLTNFPAISKPDSFQITNMIARFSFNFASSTQMLKCLAGYALCLLGDCQEIKELVINAFTSFLNNLMRNNCFIAQLNEIFPNQDKFMRLLDMVVQFFDGYITQVDCQYQKWIQTKDDLYRDPVFLTFSSENSKRTIQIFKCVTSTYFIDGNLTKAGLKDLTNYFHTWLAKQIYTFQENLDKKEKRRMNNRQNRAKQVSCTECKGVYF